LLRKVFVLKSNFCSQHRLHHNKNVQDTPLLLGWCYDARTCLSYPCPDFSRYCTKQRVSAVMHTVACFYEIVHAYVLSNDLLFADFISRIMYAHIARVKLNTSSLVIWQNNGVQCTQRLKQTQKFQLYQIHRFLADRTIGRAFGTGCRLSVCLSVVCRLSSVTFCIVAKRCILEQKFLLQRIGSRIHRIDFCRSYRPLPLFRGYFRSCCRYACVQIFPSTSETYLFTALPVLGLAASASPCASLANHSRLACQDRQILLDV